MTEYRFGDETVTVRVEGSETGLRRYEVETTQEQRNDAAKTRVFGEEGMRVRSGDALFDALMAMAVVETDECKVEEISDTAFNNGEGVPVSGFETGEEWKYIWTRDTGYAVDLAMGMMDPPRAANSLEFKTSRPKASVGTGPFQVVQDTGSGGSYPVSTDRVVWAFGAFELLKFLSGDARSAFRDLTIEALSETIEQDRDLAYDPRDGLYKGEQSFLDWREQSYPLYTANDTVHLGMSKTLSTNVGHYYAMIVCAQLAAEKGDRSMEERMTAYAESLKAAIQDLFWLPELGTFSTMKPTEFDQTALPKQDWLGLSLAILAGIATDDQAKSIVAQYPHVPMGPPVLWPQQPHVPIYHNRGIWPFVTAYGVLASRAAKNELVFERGCESLIRGAALNLSNMENFEYLSLLPFVDDGDLSGPVVNSKRQLWSVAGYIAMVVRGVFGIDVGQDGAVRFDPYVTPRFCAQHFGQASDSTVVLQEMPLRGRTLRVELVVPRTGEYSLDHSAFVVRSLLVNGVPWDATQSVPIGMFLEGQSNRVRIVLVDSGVPSAAQGVLVDTDDRLVHYAPTEPEITVVEFQQGQGIYVAWKRGDDSESVSFNVFRDSVQVATGLQTTSWHDPDVDPAGTYFYAVEAVYDRTDNRSHHSRPYGYYGPEDERLKVISADTFSNVGGEFSTEYGRPHFKNWGVPGDSLTVDSFQVAHDGVCALVLEYSNGAGSFNTGITCAVKRVTITDAASGQAVAQASLQMPQLEEWGRWEDSGVMYPVLEAGKTYRAVIDDSVNMSYLDHFEPYTAGNGGGALPYNYVNIASFRIATLGPAVRVKIAGNGHIRRCTIPAKCSLKRFRAGLPGCDGRICWKDDDGDLVTVHSEAEWAAILSRVGQGEVLRLEVL